MNRDLLYAEYHKTDGEWRPCSIVTTKQNGSRVSQTQYDVDWCKRDERLYSHESGGGGGLEVCIHGFCDAPKICGRIWVREDAELVHYVKIDDKWVTAPLPRERLASMGYEVLAEPLSPDPLEDCEQETETQYCRICDDYLPSSYEERLCNHLFYVDSGGWGGCGSPEVRDEEVAADLRAVFATLNEVELVALRNALTNQQYQARVHGSMFGSDWLEFELGDSWPKMDIGPKLTDHARAIRDGDKVDGGWMDGINWLRSLDKADGCRKYEAFAVDCITEWLANMAGFSMILDMK